MARPKKIRIQDNPGEHLREVMAQLAESGTPIEVFNIDIHRRDRVTGSMRYLVSWDGQNYERIEMLPALIKEQFGGGDYEVTIKDPNKNMQAIHWPIPIEGDPKKPELPYGSDVVPPGIPIRPGATMPQNDVLSPYGMYRNPVTGRYQSVFQDQQSNPMNNPYFSGLGINQGHNEDTKYYRDKYEELRREFDRYKDEANEKVRMTERALHEEKQARQNEVMMKQHELMMTQLQEKNQKEMNELRLLMKENSKPKSDETDRLYQAIIESNKANTTQMMELMRHDVDATKNQFELMQRQFDNQMKMNQEYVNQVIKLNDPSKNAEVFNILGAQATNMFTLITQVAESGLFGKEESPWLDLMKQFAYGVKDLGEKFISNQQQQMQTQSRMIRHPQMPGYGSPTLPAGQPQPKQQKPIDDARMKVQRELVENPIIKMALPKLYEKIAQKANPQDIANDLMDHIDYMGRQGMLPSVFHGILDNPEEVMKNVLELLPINLEEAYADQIIDSVGKIVVEIRKEHQELEQEEKQTGDVEQEEKTETVEKQENEKENVVEAEEVIETQQQAEQPKEEEKNVAV